MAFPRGEREKLTYLIHVYYERCVITYRKRETLKIINKASGNEIEICGDNMKRGTWAIENLRCVAG